MEIPEKLKIAINIFTTVSGSEPWKFLIYRLTEKP